MLFDIFSPSNLHVQLAYLDPASGSLIIQAAIAGIAGAAFFMRNSIKRVTDAIFHRGTEVEVDDLDASDTEEE